MNLYTYCHEVAIIFQYAIVTDRAGVQPIGCRLGPGLQLTAMPRPGLPFNGRHPRNPCNCMDHYSFLDPQEMEA